MACSGVFTLLMIPTSFAREVCGGPHAKFTCPLQSLSCQLMMASMRLPFSEYLPIMHSLNLCRQRERREKTLPSKTQEQKTEATDNSFM